jgi:hypothetical protein
MLDRVMPHSDTVGGIPRNFHFRRPSRGDYSSYLEDEAVSGGVEEGHRGTAIRAGDRKAEGRGAVLQRVLR